MTRLRLSTTAILTLVLLPLAAAPASAAPPGNDTPAGAVEITVGQTVNQDTTEATTDAGDAALNAGCGAPFTNASVWYTFTPAEDATLVLDMTKSSYSGGFLVFAGTPAADSLVTCGPGAVAVEAVAGTAYSVMVISDTETNGGSLVLSLTKAQPPPRVAVHVAKRGLAFRGGAARIHGTYFCKGGSGPAFLGARLVQRAGRLKIPARAGTPLRCDGTARHWSLRMVSPVGIYARGRAHVSVRIDACGPVECRHDRAGRDRVRLVPTRRHPSAGTAQPPTRTRTERPHPLALSTRRWPGTP